MKSKYSNPSKYKTTASKAVSDEEIKEKIEEEFSVNLPIIKPILENDLLKFNKSVLNIEKGKGNKKLAPVHEELCRFVDKNKHKKKLLLIPRGHLKSTITTIGYITQQIVKNPSIRVLIANATYSLSCSFLTEIKRNLKFNENIHMIWGDLTKDAPNWSQNQITLKYSKKKEPTVTAMGVESNLTSQHFDLIVFDDVVNKDYVNTREQIEKTIGFYKECLNLLEPNGETIIIGTRWHDDDLYGWILDKENKVLNDFEVFLRRAYEGSLKKSDDFQALWPEKFTQTHLRKLYDQQGPYVFCTPGESPVLMEDFTTKPISEVKVGDEVVGFDRGDKTRNGKMIKTKVKAVSKHEEYVCDFKMESGRKVRCTKNHKWYSRKVDETHRMYKPAKVGTKLPFVCEPGRYISFKEQMLWGYLGGFFDGDGSAKAGAKVSFTQCGKSNDMVYKKLISVLNDLGLDYGEYIRKHDNTKWNDGNMIWLRNSFNAVVDMIRYSDFGKKSQLVERLYEQGSKFIKENDRVLDIVEGSKKETVYGLETETGNYVVWGYASSNSTQYLNDPIPQEDATFKKRWFQYYDPTDLKGRLLNKFIMIDPAISMEKEADFTAMVVVGVDEFGTVYVLDVIRERMSPSEIIDEVFRLASVYSPIKIGIEDVAFQKSLQYSLTEAMHERNKYLPMQPLRPAGRNKDQRISGLQPLYANGKILHGKQIDKLQFLEDELLRFPRGKHDDTIDALSYMLDIPVYKPKRRTKSNKTSKRYLY